MDKKSEFSQTPVRLPLDLKRWLKHKAIDNRRSLNNEIVMRLQESKIKEGSKDNTSK
jgi:hypothetical protein